MVQVLIEEFDAEEDYEEYDLETCSPELMREDIGYGQRFSPDGKDLGKVGSLMFICHLLKIESILSVMRLSNIKSFF